MCEFTALLLQITNHIFTDYFRYLFYDYCMMAIMNVLSTDMLF